ESTTSRAVTIAPASPTAVAIRPMAFPSAGTETRTVIENPALGIATIRMTPSVTLPPSSLTRGRPMPGPGWGRSRRMGRSRRRPRPRSPTVAGLMHVRLSDPRATIGEMNDDRFEPALDNDIDFDDFDTTGDLELADRNALRRVAGLSTELA